MYVFEFTGEAEVYNSPFYPYEAWEKPRILVVKTTEIGESEIDAMRIIAREISSIYSDDWQWLWWKATR
ncbi:MAG: hypothetical protein ETSY2_24060 [Candidatus Entotheonella gemina]|uniref:Uncharacterized protein n=1 Tax=Candidatus Entotheonella gemina TaxID=1429439 RepID=W4M4H2_9BACT|nr:MAG: hypothetical protein ETSY2_24060 [Candidatus Entotheonella gemina]